MSAIPRPRLGHAYHAIGTRISLGDVFSLLDGLLANDLDPVAVGVKHKGNVLHATVAQLLLELVPGVLDALAGRLQVVDTDAGVAEPAVRLRVTVDDLVVGVVLGAVVVGELDDALAVHKRVAVGGGLGAVVSEKVQVKLGIGVFDLVDDAHSEELVEFNCKRLDFESEPATPAAGDDVPDTLGSLTRILAKH